MSEPVKHEHIKVFHTWTTGVQVEWHPNSKFIRGFNKVISSFIQRAMRSDGASVHALSVQLKQKLLSRVFHCRTQSRLGAAKSLSLLHTS